MKPSTLLNESFPQILAAARTGAEWAWTSIYHDLASHVLGYLRANKADDAEDLTGEVFLQVVRDLGRFEGSEKEFRSWVFTIAHHRMLDSRRRHARRPLEPLVRVIAEEQGGDVEAEALAHLGAERVRSVIERLAPDQREVLLLRILGGLTVREVAEALGKTQGAVKALQRRGLAVIERMLAAEGVTV
jgi:RNA polymerase sigma factor (sigma-70 family)